MITATVTIDTRVLDRVQKGMQEFPRRTRIEFANGVARAEGTLLTRVRYTPPKWTGGRREWESEKQRRAYFATNGFGSGIPYRRTGKHSRGFQLVTDMNTDGGTISLTNTVPYAQFVTGHRQQKMHKNTGWPFALDEVTTIQQQLNRELDAAVDRVLKDIFA